MNSRASQHARGCSPWTLMGCGCGLLSMLAILLIFLLLGIMKVRERLDPRWSAQDYATCQNNILYLGSAIDSYRKDHHRFPKDLSELSPRYLRSPAQLRCPLEAKGLGKPYVYTPDSKGDTAPLITCTNHGQGAIVLQRDLRLRFPRR